MSSQGHAAPAVDGRELSGICWTARPARQMVLVVSLVVVFLLGVASVASAANHYVSFRSQGEGSGQGLGGSGFVSQLLIPGGEVLLGSEQLQLVREARHANPEAFAARERSRGAFADLDATQAMRVAGEAFPRVIDESAGGPPQLPAGTRVVSYIGSNAAQLSLPAGKHGVLRTLGPIAKQTAPGHYAPIDLGLVDAGGVYAPALSDAAVSIPERLSDGVRLSGAGVSLTPTGAGGASLGGTATLEHAAVFYANTQRDTDTLVKPTTGGFEIDSLLRAQDSPQQLCFQVGMPAGARLRETGSGSATTVEVIDAGRAIAAIAAPSASDATGEPVPVSMGVVGSTLVLTVAHPAGAYRYPIVVDPYVIEKGRYGKEEVNVGYTWGFTTTESSAFTEAGLVNSKGEEYGAEDIVSSSVAAGNKGVLNYHTEGESKIYEASAETSSESDLGKPIDNRLLIYNPHIGTEGGSEGNVAEWMVPYTATSDTLCTESGCGAGKVESSNDANEVWYEQYARESGWAFTSKLLRAAVYITQEKGPSTGFVPSSEKWTKTSQWYGYELKAEDLGLGISGVHFTSSSVPGWKQGTPIQDGFTECVAGVQCEQCYSSENCGSFTHREPLTLNSEGLPEGEDPVKAVVEDPVGLTAEATTTVKIDNTPPHGLSLSGLPPGNEIAFGRYVLRASATDGSGSTPSSGVASIAVSIDGKEIGAPNGSCSRGPCTASGEWVIKGEEYVAGRHTIEVTATDAAGNKASAEFPLIIHSAESQSAGPGSVELGSGALTLAPTDVSIGAPGAGLTLQRSYNSRRPTAGEEGPLGPQWSGLSVSVTESLTKLPTGSMVLQSAGGGRSLFTKEGSKFVPPAGDSNLTLTEVSSTEFTLTGQTGTVTTLTVPEGGSGTIFTPASVETPGGTQTVKYRYQTGEPSGGEYSLSSGSRPEQIATGPDGNLWVTCSESNKIEKITPLGVITEYSLPSGSSPQGIVAGPGGENALWFTEMGSNKIGRITTSGEIKEYPLSESGGPYGIVAGPSSEGALWFTDYRTSKIGRITTGGAITAEYALSNKESGTTGIAAGPEGELWFTNPYIGKVGKMTTSGTEIKEYELSNKESRPDTIVAGPEGDMWFVEIGTSKIAKIPASGSPISEYSLPAGSHPWGIVPGPDGNMWFTEAAGKVGKIPTSGSPISEYSLLPENGAVGITVGPENNLWYVDHNTGKVGEIATTGAVEPQEAVAPEAAGVSCGKEPSELKDGCRALTFAYSKATTAKGDSPSEWGEYRSRLKEVFFNAYNTSSKAMEKIAVADYTYDAEGRLRAEWDPQISPALKTTYGYDAEGHVTAVSEPGRQPWYFNYGMIASDTHSGRLMSVTRPNASTALGSGTPPVNTVVPKLSTSSPVEGTEVTVSTGTWSGSPGAYGYQWESCNGLGGECTPIVGAINPGYTPRYSDEEHTLRAQVTATNAGGSVIAYTAVSAVVPAKEFPPTYSLSIAPSGSEAFKSPSYAAVGFFGGEERVYVTDTGDDRVEGFTTSGAYENEIGEAGNGKGKFKEPTGIAAEGSNLWVADSGDKLVQLFNGSTYEHQVSTHGTLGGMSVGEWPYQYVALREDNAFEELLYMGFFETNGNYYGSLGSENGKLDDPTAVAWYPPMKWILVADTANNRIEVFNAKGEYAGQFGKSGVGNGEFKGPEGIAVDSEGNVWVADTGNDRVQELKYNSTTSSWTYLTQYGKKGTGHSEFETPMGIAVDKSNNVYVVDSANKRVEKLIAGKRPADSPLPPATAPNPGTSSVETIEYEVPVSGTGAPHEMSGSELEKWGEKEVPVEATAIFPPSEPMGWPAKSYKDATVYYRDDLDRTVNVASPTTSLSGAISTSEYNSFNDVVRSLSVDNRVVALKETCESKEKCKSAELAKLLDTESKYNGETSEEKTKEEAAKDLAPGTRLLETLGPRHEIKLDSNHEEKEGRSHTFYYYNEGAPSEGGPYNLVTKTVQKAKIEGSETEQDERTTTTSYSGQENLGWKLRKPTSVTSDPSELKLTHTTVYEKTTGNVIETETPAASGKDASVMPVYSTAFGSEGEGAGKLKYPTAAAVDGSGDIWVTDYVNSRIEEFSVSGTFIEAIGWGVSNGKPEFEICKTTCQAGIAGSGLGQFKEPTAIAINQSTGGVYIADLGNDRIEQLNAKGEYVRTWGKEGSEHGQFQNPAGVAVDSSGNVWVADFGNNRVQEFSSEGVFKAAYGTYGSGEGQFHWPVGIAFSGGNMYVVDQDNSRVEELSMTGEYKGQFGSKGSGNGQFSTPYGIATDPTSGDLYVVDYGNSRVEKFSPSGTYLGQFGSKGSGGGQFNGLERAAVNSAGDVFVPDAGNDRVQEWIPTITGNEGARDTKTIYYTSAANSEYAACGEHPEWANLVCEERPAAQPETSGLPELPVTTYTKYNILDEPLTVSSTSGSQTRTSTITYDTAGRPLTAETTSTVGTALPKVSYKYEEASGASIEQSTSSESLKNVYNTLGQLTSYTDAAGNVSTFEYENEKDERLKKLNDGKGTDTYTYNETTGAVQELVDSAAGKFTASYDLEGNLTNEGYPNGMSADYTYNQVGEATGLEYVKTTHCSSSCTWYSDSLIASIHGETLSQTSTLAKQTYSYDGDGRLIEAQETPTGKNCVIRNYTFDEETNRIALTTYEPSGETCTDEKPTTVTHAYDTANRLDEPGVKYDEYGNTTELPAADAGGSALTSSFYVNNRLASQTQAGETIGYQLDPSNRVQEIDSTGKIVSSVVNHYTGPGASTPAWTSETSGAWTRNIEGIGVGLVAIQKNGETPVLQLTDLKGNIVATAELSETGKLIGTYRSTEYGVPTTEAPPKYSWLGAHEIPTELPSGSVAMGARSYIPQLGRFLQTDPRPGGSANAYAYTYGDPVDSTDLSGEYTQRGLTAEGLAYSNKVSEAGAAEQAAINAAARAEAERKAAEAAEAAGLEGEESGEELEEEGEEEYAAYHHGAKPGSEEGYSEGSGVFYGSLEEATESNEGKNAESQPAVKLCEPGQTGLCARFVGKKKGKRKKRNTDARCSPSTGHNPHDPDEQCCADGTHYGHYVPGGEVCDGRAESGSPPARQRSAECAYGEEEYVMVDGELGCTLASTDQDNGGGSVEPD
jgi:RHS repeat-associated protein